MATGMIQEIAKHFFSFVVEIATLQVETENSIVFTAFNQLGFKEYGRLSRGFRFEEIYKTIVLMVIPISRLLSLL